MTRQLEKIGQLSFSRADCLGSGRFGKVFIGKLTSDDGVIDVAIKRMEKEKIIVESIILPKVNGHPNVINYYTIDESDVEFTSVIKQFNVAFKHLIVTDILMFYF
jgi:hypothetical protein